MSGKKKEKEREEWILRFACAEMKEDKRIDILRVKGLYYITLYYNIKLDFSYQSPLYREMCRMRGEKEMHALVPRLSVFILSTDSVLLFIVLN